MVCVTIFIQLNQRKRILFCFLKCPPSWQSDSVLSILWEDTGQTDKLANWEEKPSYISTLTNWLILTSLQQRDFVPNAYFLSTGKPKPSHYRQSKGHDLLSLLAAMIWRRYSEHQTTFNYITDLVTRNHILSSKGTLYRRASCIPKRARSRQFCPKPLQ